MIIEVTMWNETEYRFDTVHQLLDYFFVNDLDVNDIACIKNYFPDSGEYTLDYHELFISTFGGYNVQS